MAIISVAQARAYAHDNESTDAEIEEYIMLAEKYMDAAIGTYSHEDPRVKHLAKLLVCDFDNERSTTAKDSNTRRMLIQSIILQLQVDATVSKLD